MTTENRDLQPVINDRDSTNSDLGGMDEQTRERLLRIIERGQECLNNAQNFVMKATIVTSIFALGAFTQSLIDKNKNLTNMLGGDEQKIAPLCGIKIERFNASIYKPEIPLERNDLGELIIPHFNPKGRQDQIVGSIANQVFKLTDGKNSYVTIVTNNEGIGFDNKSFSTFINFIGEQNLADTEALGFPSMRVNLFNQSLGGVKGRGSRVFCDSVIGINIYAPDSAPNLQTDYFNYISTSNTSPKPFDSSSDSISFNPDDAFTY